MPRRSMHAMGTARWSCVQSQTICLCLVSHNQHAWQVSDILLGIFKTSGKVKPLDKLWQERRIDVERVPDDFDTPERWSADERRQADDLLNFVATLLTPLAPQLNVQPTPAGMRSCMKVLALLSPHVSHNKVVIPFKPDSTHASPLLLYEACYLKSLAAVHSKLAATTGESCACPAATGQQASCNCIADLILSETTSALRQLGISDTAINRCLQKHCINLGQMRLDLLGSHAAPAQPPPQPKPQSSQTMAERPDVRILDVDAARVGDGPAGNFGTPDSIATGAAGDFHRPAPAAPTRVENPQKDKPLEVEAVANNDRPLIPSSTMLSENLGGQPSFLYLPEGFVPHVGLDQNKVVSEARGLLQLTLHMLTHVFNYSVGANRVFVFYDPEASAVAFNRGQGQSLWFNAAVHVDTRGFSSLLAAQLRFWFLICAHELTHNTVSNHDRKFSDVCSAIVLQHASRFEQYVHHILGQAQPQPGGQAVAQLAGGLVGPSTQFVPHPGSAAVTADPGAAAAGQLASGVAVAADIPLP